MIQDRKMTDLQTISALPRQRANMTQIRQSIHRCASKIGHVYIFSSGMNIILIISLKRFILDQDVKDYIFSYQGKVTILSD